ncbi:MAG TPA: ABC transporter permease [Vicinamibacterales bacterium]|nr:ABC transporter permease [Vicinamibacterales bacterium]
MSGPWWKRALRRRSDVDTRVDAEVAFHVDSRIDELVRQGAAPDAAREQARAEFGDVEAVRASLRTIDRRMSGRAPGGTVLRSIVTDAQLAWRSCRRQPGVTAAIVLSLALGLGAATAMFAVVRAVLLAPLPYRQPDRLVALWSRWDAADRTWLASIDVRDIRARSQLIEDVAMWTWDRVTLTGAGDAASINAGIVTANTFDVLGASPLYGRVFSESEALAATRSGRTMYAVLGYDLWRNAFAADPAVVGRTITIDDQPVTVLGVMPARFQLPTDFGRASAAATALWTPIYNDPAMNEGGHSYFGAARLRPGVSLAAANTELAGFAADFTRTGRYNPAMQFGIFAQRIDDDVFGGVRPSMRVLVAAVVAFLLIACANAAALLVARAETRGREWATRVALGAGRWRLLRSQLVEGALLALSGGILGVGLALAAKRMLDVVGTAAIPRVADVAVDWGVVAFMLALSFVATVLSSLAPALHALRLNTVEGLKDGGRTNSPGRGRLRLRALLVVLQLAFGMLLLTSAGLLGRTLLTMRHVDLGLEPAHVLTAGIALPAARYSKAGDANRYVEAMTARLRQLPGVTAAGLVRVLPLAQTIGDWPVAVEGYAPRPGERPTGDWQAATPGALEALGERLMRGRFFTDADTAAAPVVALVNETMARLYWPGRDPVGLRMRFSDDEPLVWATVVGVVGDVHHNGLTTAIKAKFYLPYAQFAKATGDKPLTTGTIVLRTDGDPLSLVASLRSAAAAVDRTVPVSAVRPMTDVVETALTTPRLTSLVMTGFAAVALLLSALGVFGLLVYLVAQRTHEIGIRLAIGASSGDVARLVLAHGLRLGALGLSIGLCLSAVAARGLSSLLYGVGPSDPLTWTIAPGVLLAVIVVASVIPAVRASAISPVRVLRSG